MNFIKGRKYISNSYKQKFTIVATDNESEGRIVEVIEAYNPLHVLNYQGDWNTHAFTLLPIEDVSFKLLP